MVTLYPAQYRFTRATEVKYVEWMFPRNRTIINSAVILTIGFIIFITGADYFSKDRSFDFFSLILLLRVLMAGLTLSILYALGQKNPVRAQQILFIDIFLVAIIYSIDN